MPPMWLTFYLDWLRLWGVALLDSFSKHDMLLSFFSSDTKLTGLTYLRSYRVLRVGFLFRLPDSQCCFWRSRDQVGFVRSTPMACFSGPARMRSWSRCSYRSAKECASQWLYSMSFLCLSWREQWAWWKIQMIGPGDLASSWGSFLSLRRAEAGFLTLMNLFFSYLKLPLFLLKFQSIEKTRFYFSKAII